MFLASSCSYPKLAPQPMRPGVTADRAARADEPVVRDGEAGGHPDVRRVPAPARRGVLRGDSSRRVRTRRRFQPRGLPRRRRLDAAHARGQARRRRRRSTSGAAASSGASSSYVDDLASACVFAMQHYTGDGPLNLGGGRDTSIADLAQAIKDVVGFAGALRFDTSKPDGMPLKALDGSELPALGWQPVGGFPRGVGADLPVVPEPGNDRRGSTDRVAIRRCATRSANTSSGAPS